LKIKTDLGISVFTAAIALIMGSSIDARSWDQLLPFKYNSHSIITTDATLAANRTLRATRDADLAVWTHGLYWRLTPRLLPSLAPMGRSELNGGFYPELHLDDGTLYTLNRLEEGNTVIDKPKLFSQLHSAVLFDNYCRFFSENMGGMDAATCKNLPNIGRGQAPHFLRDFRETGGKPELAPAAESCARSVKLIKSLTREAQSHWAKARAEGDKEKAMREMELMYMFNGIAVHAIEDSFSPAHTQRSASNPRVIEDLCYYYDNSILPPSEAKACAHAIGDGKEPRDSVHFTGNSQYPSNAIPAALAVKAAQAYLTGFANTMLDDTKGWRSDVEPFLNEFLVTGSQEGMGYFDCSTLK